MEAESNSGGADVSPVNVDTKKIVNIAPVYVRVTDVEKINFKKLFRDIDLHVDVGLKLYQAQRSENDSTFYGIFSKLKEFLKETRTHQEKLSARVSKYDFVGFDGVPVKANGYRHILFLMYCLLQQLLQSLQKAAKDRTKFRVPINENINSLSLYCCGLCTIERMAHFCCVLMEGTPAPQLFNYGAASVSVKRGNVLEVVPRNLFYGQLLGFQYAGNMKPVLKMLALGLASYEEWYQADKDEPVKQLLSSLWRGSKYLKSPTRLGAKLDELTTDTSVHFVKAFWSLSEQPSLQGAAKLAYQSVEINQWMEIPSMPLKVQTSGGEIEMSPPSAHLGYKPINILLLSNRWRGSQTPNHSTARKPLAPSPGLIIHFHGGGYVAQGPLSHSSYLRQWTFKLDTPIISVDYSLSPEAPYPRALEECVFAYCWALKNLDKIGTTGEKIVLVGDSAGGNFCITVPMKLKQLGIRQPTAVISVYPSTNVTSGTSPSRINSIVDPILPLGTMIACQQAYSNQSPTAEVLTRRKEYRQRIQKAQGCYPFNPDNKTTTKKSQKRFTWKKSKNENGAGAVAEYSKEKAAGSKVPPPRPPPPSGSVTKVDLEAVTAPKEETPAVTTEEKEAEVMLESVSLESHAPAGTDSPTRPRAYTDGAVGVQSAVDGEESINIKGLLSRREPDDGDKLTPTELEELVSEVMKVYETDSNTQDPFMSPVFATDEQLAGLPPVHIIGAALDSLLDDSVSMAQRLKSANQPVTLNVIDNLPHGFLSLITTGNNTDHNHALHLCLDYLKGELVTSASTRTSVK